MNNWNHITFEDGSNPYITKTEQEFNRIKNKYNLYPTGISNFYIAKKK